VCGVCVFRVLDVCFVFLCCVLCELVCVSSVSLCVSCSLLSIPSVCCVLHVCFVCVLLCFLCVWCVSCVIAVCWVCLMCSFCVLCVCLYQSFLPFACELGVPELNIRHISLVFYTTTNERNPRENILIPKLTTFIVLSMDRPDFKQRIRFLFSETNTLEIRQTIGVCDVCVTCV